MSDEVEVTPDRSKFRKRVFDVLLQEQRDRRATATKSREDFNILSCAQAIAEDGLAGSIMYAGVALGQCAGFSSEEAIGIFRRIETAVSEAWDREIRILKDRVLDRQNERN